MNVCALQQGNVPMCVCVCVRVCVCAQSLANLRKGSSEVQQEVWDASSSQGVLLNGTSQQGKQGDCCRPVALPLVPTAVLSPGDTFGLVPLPLNVFFSTIKPALRTALIVGSST